MKGKFSFLLFGAVFSMSVYADWKEVEQTIAIDSADSETIGLQLGYMSDLQHQLLGLELSRPDKIVVSHLLVKYHTLKWENDDYCKVEDPDSVPMYLTSSVEFDSYWTANPSQIDHGRLMQSAIHGSPCILSPMPEPFPTPLPANMVKTTFKFNNKVKTL